MQALPIVIAFPRMPPIERVIVAVGGQPRSFLLDSADASHSQSRFSYAGIRPSRVITGGDDPWACLDKLYQGVGMKLGARSVPPSNVFTGGWVGYIGYESYRFIPPYEAIPARVSELPGYWFGFFDAVLVMDHEASRAFLCSLTLSHNELKAYYDAWMGLLENAPLAMKIPSSSGNIAMPSLEEYADKVRRVRKYLKKGDAYQVNVTERFEADYQGSVASLYSALRERTPAPYGSLLNTGLFHVLSASPESFITLSQGTLTTRPIKGTRPRGSSRAEDELIVSELAKATKDRAELLMIVDLERNDLGRVCEIGSVIVTGLFEVESFATLHHLVGTVTGKLKEGLSPVTALKHLFPGGSVTGAPKKRAMEIIAELETHARSVYTGALGYIGVDGEMMMNLPIRTMVLKDSRAYFYAGCGIVMDSEPAAEYDEMMVKAKAMMEALACKYI